MATTDAKVEVVLDNWFPRFLGAGLDYFDVRAILAEVTAWDEWEGAWTRGALRYEQLADVAADAGHALTAAEHRLRASITVQFAQFVLTEDPARREALHRRSMALFARAAPDLAPPAERVVIPGGRAPLYGYLRKPAGIARPPVAVLVLGLESTKEQLAATVEPAYLARGMATLTIEGPGQGESWYDIPLSAPAFHDAFVALGNSLLERDDVDGDRVAMTGQSLGGHLVFWAATAIPRVRGVIALAGSYDMATSVREADERQQVVVDGLLHITKSPDRAALEAVLEPFTLEHVLPRIAAPVLIVHGAKDPIVDVEDAYRMKERLGDRAELWVEPEGNHVCQNLAVVLRPRVADWLADRLVR